MRRSLLATTSITLLGLAVMGASTCNTNAPAARSFGAGSLVIPMDNCYQRRDASATDQTVGCTTAANADDGVLRAYGLVYFLLKNGVHVYWAVAPKLTATAPDVTVPAPSSGAVVQKLKWNDGSFVDFAFPAATGITYVGGPFIIDADDAARAIAMMTSAADAAHADFARFQGEAVVDIHKVQVAFNAAQVRPITTTPPKIAILNVTPPAGKKTASNVMYQYAVAAGLSWPCAGTGDCAGGLGRGCDKAGVLAYLANPGGDGKIPQVCNNGLCAPNFNTGPGLIYDVLCDGDFIPPGAGETYADTQLAAGNYRLLWIPHWDTSGTTPTGSANASLVPALPATTAADRLAWQLRTISSFVQAGNNVFGECLGIQALEGVTGEDAVNGSPLGIPATRFQSPAGIQKWNGTGGGTLTLQPLLDAAHPDMQIGDFNFSVVSGAITTFFPRSNQTPADAYLPTVERFITETPATTPPSNWDVASTVQVAGAADSGPKGSVAYLGGHDYSPTSDPWPHTTADKATKGQTAGTRIVLNTLFNLGFACADPNTDCTTGLLGACATGVLKCAGGGGLQCVAPAAGAPVCDGSDIDANCNGIPDKFEAACQQPSCIEGASRNCYGGPAGTDGVGECHHGTQTCTGGVWGPCADELQPQPEVCNGKDDDCKGGVDDGNLCGQGSTCTGGVCLPSSCNIETAHCPSGYQCSSAVGGTCQPTTCAEVNGPCPAGKVCQGAKCVDPCDPNDPNTVKCGAGSSCSGGKCVAGGCAITPCTDPAAPVCLGGRCVADACDGNTCPTGTFCRLGDCVRSCAYVSCAPGQHCDADGFCQSDCTPTCAAGQACVAGTCVPDGCAAVQCASGQECQDGACVDQACGHMRCPDAGSTCVAGQCVGGVTTSVVTPITPAPKSGGGGCGTGGAGDLASLALAAGAMWSRRRRLAPLLTRARSGAVVAFACALAAGFTGCSKAGGAAQSCASGQTACGGECADLAASTLHCGACGHGCPTSFSCTAGACAFPTGNPFVEAVAPAAFGLGASPALHLTGIGFQPGAKLRIEGIGDAKELTLTVESSTAATLPETFIDMTGAAVGEGRLRVVNPGKLISNALALTIIDSIGIRSVAPAFVRQDASAAVDLTVRGVGFVQNVVVSLTVAGAVQVLPTTFTGPGEVHATLPAPNTLPVGRHALVVTIPGGASSAPATFAVNEGKPTIASILPPACAVTALFAGQVTGSFLYPTSVVQVTGGTIVNSPLITTCFHGTDALGQCVGGQLQVNADLSGVTPGFYNVTVRNPGSPDPLTSTEPFKIEVRSACP